MTHVHKSLYGNEPFCHEACPPPTHPRPSHAAGGDWTVSLTEGSLAALEGIQLQLAANLVGPNVQISGIDASSINNITLQVRRQPCFCAPRQPDSHVSVACSLQTRCFLSDRPECLAADVAADEPGHTAADWGAGRGPAEQLSSDPGQHGPSQCGHPAHPRPVLTTHSDLCQSDHWAAI